MEIEQELRRYITAELGAGEAGPPRDDDPLIELGLLDSLKIFRMLAHVEKTFGVALDPAQLSVESFNSIESIARLVRAAQTDSRGMSSP